MDWMRHTQPSLFAKSITRCFKKKLLRYILGYSALFLLLIYLEAKTGFLVGRSCQTGALITVFPGNKSDGFDESSSYYFLQNQRRAARLNRAINPESNSNSTARFHALPPGEYVQTGSPEAFIPTAVRILDHPQLGDFTVLLHAWARNYSKVKFHCCFLRSLNDDIDQLVSVQSIPHKQNTHPNSNSEGNDDTFYKAWSSEFYCSISKQEMLRTNHISSFNYVTFSSDNSCNSKSVSRGVLKIGSDEKVFRSVGVCLSLQRTFVNAEYFVEWLEWYRLQGVTEVFVYYDHTLNRAIERVLKYYQLIGFVRAHRLQHPDYYYRESLPFFNEEMASNDCRHRMSHFDYVITLDVSELMAPKHFHVDIYDILKNTSVMYPNAGVFQIHSYQIILDWRPSRNTPLHIARHELRSDSLNMGEDDRLSRWAYIPQRAQLATKRKAWPKQAFTSKAVPKESYSLLRFIRCHPRLARDCAESSSKVKDSAISRFQNALITGMREIPIDYVLEFNKKYVEMFNKVRIPGDNYYIGSG